MADDDAAAGGDERGEDTPAVGGPPAPRLDVEMRFVESLPGGMAVLPVEEEGRFAWLVAQGHISPQARTEMLRSLRHIVGSGLWVQKWQPPQAGS